MPQQNKTKAKTCITTWHSSRKNWKNQYESQNELQSKSCGKSNGEENTRIIEKVFICRHWKAQIIMRKYFMSFHGNNFSKLEKDA